MTESPIRFDFNPFRSPVTTIAGLIVAGDDGEEFRAFGSGFLATTHLAFTARHVIDEICRHFQVKPLYELTGKMPFGVQLATVDELTGSALKWNITDFHYSRSIDITAMSIEPAEDLGQNFEWVLPSFDVVPPGVGATITAFGYPHTTFRSVPDDGFRVTLSPKTSNGVVKTVHPEYRDRGLLSFPCLQSNAIFDAGMSGGPVFNKDGRVCAMVCSGMPPTEKGQEYVSHASLIWPAFGLRFNDARAKQRTPRFIRSEAEDNRMHVGNIERVTVEASSDGQDKLRYRGSTSPVQ